MAVAGSHDGRKDMKRMNERSALLVVDVQIDFCPGGSLAVPGGDAAVPVINRYIELFRSLGHPVIASRDWHPPVTKHFREFGGIWPPHCIQGSRGASFHPRLALPDGALVVSKGMDPEQDDYSALDARLETGTTLKDHLAAGGVKNLYVCGLATDYCVRETSLDALATGFTVTVLQDACKGVNLKKGDSARALEEIAGEGGKLADFASVERELGAAGQQTG
jgi:nicotinamidase/pyrazinamidase